MAVPSRVVASTAWTSSGAAGSPLNVPRPVGVVSGDWIIVSLEGQGTNITTPPTGWTEVVPQTLNSSSRFIVWRRQYDGGANDPSGGYNFTSDGGNVQTAAVTTVRSGAASSAWVVGTPNVRSGSVTLTTANSITAPTNSLVLSIFGESSTAAEGTAPALTGTTLWWNTGEPSAGIVRQVLVGYKDQPTAGATGNSTATYPNASAAGVGVQIAIPFAAVTPTLAHAGVYRFENNLLGAGAKVAGTTSLYATAQPTAGGSVVTGTTGTADSNGFAHSDISGLTKGTAYTVRIYASDGTLLETLSAKTLTDVPASFKIITGSCQQNNAVAGVYNTMALENADFFVHQGDLHYKDAQAAQDWVDGVNGALVQPNMKNFLKTTPMSYHIDNHDWGGNQSYKDSPAKDFVPQLTRQLMGDYQYPAGFYGAWSHKGVKFIHTDQWSLRDFGQDSDPTRVGKTMLGDTQRQWLFDSLLASKEAVIIWFCSFPLYGNFVANGRWGDFRWEAQQIQNFLDAHPGIKSRIVCVGGDSHNVVADSGANTMWNLPSLNASPFDRDGDPGGLPSGTWDIANLERGTNGQYYSRVSFTWSGPKVIVLWEAVRQDNVVVANWSKAFVGSGLSLWNGTTEVAVNTSIWNGTSEVPIVTATVV